MNPGQFDRAAWMRQRGFRANLRTDRIEVISGPGLFHKLRAKLSGRIKRSSSPKVSGLASALLLGERRSLDRDFVENLRKTGGAHFLAVSGLHLSVIAMGFWFLLSLLPIRRSWKLGSLLVLLWIYAFLTGLPTSVVRATIMMTLWLGADLVGKKRDPLVSLATAALLLLLWDPGQRKEIGFQLSFLAVLGIFLLLPLFPKKKFLGLLFVTLSAWAMTFPVVHSQFNLLSPAVSLTTLLFFPLILVVMAGGTLALLHPDAGKITTIAYAGLEQAAAFSASLPITHFSGPAPLPGSLFLYYAGLATWVFWMRHRPRAWKLALLPLLLLPLGIQRSPEPGVSFTVLAMGRGHCVYGEFSDGRNFLFDAGSLDHADPGRDIIVPFLWSRGITRIDFLFLSHPDADHVNGTESVLEHIEVGRIILPPSFRGGELAGRLQDRLPVSFLERAADPVPVAPGIDLLGPPDWDRFGGSPRTNDSSLVLLLSAGSGKILLTGDIEARATGRLLEEVRDLRADILVVPHHGKSNKNMEELIRNVDPVITIVPGPRRYASGKTLDLLEDKTLLLVTGTTGAIDVKPGGNRWLVRTFRGYFRAAR